MSHNDAPRVIELDKDDSELDKDDSEADSNIVSKSLVKMSDNNSAIPVYEKLIKEMQKQNDRQTQQHAIQAKQLDATLAVVKQDREERKTKNAQIDKLLQSNEKKDAQMEKLTQALLSRASEMSNAGGIDFNFHRKRKRSQNSTELTAEQKKLRLWKLKRNELIDKIKQSGKTEVDEAGNMTYDYSNFDGFNSGKRIPKEEMINFLSHHQIFE